MDVFLLWHVYELTDGDGTWDEEKFIGVFLPRQRRRMQSNSSKRKRDSEITR